MLNKQHVGKIPASSVSTNTQALWEIITLADMMIKKKKKGGRGLVMKNAYRLQE